MPELVALDLPAGPGFVDALRSVWDAGDAVLPVDPRLPVPSVRRLLAVLRPSRIVSADGTRPLAGGLPTEPGDAAGGRHQRHDRGAEGSGPHPPVGDRLGRRVLPAAPGRPGGRPVGGLPSPRPHRGTLGGDPLARDRHPVQRARTVRAGRCRGRVPGGCHPRIAGGHRARSDGRVRVPGRAPRGCGPARVPPRRGDHHLRDDRDRVGDRLRRAAPRRRRAPHRRRGARERWRGARARTVPAPLLPRRVPIPASPAAGTRPATRAGSRPTAR